MNRFLMKAMAFLAVPVILAAGVPTVSAEPFFEDGPAMAQRPGGEQGPRGWGGGDRAQAIQQLGITPEQLQRIKAIQEQGRAESQGLMQQMKTKRQALMQYLQSPDANEARARAMSDELNDLQRRASDLRLRTWFQIRSELSPEQIQKFTQMRQQRMQQGGGGRMGPRRGVQQQDGRFGGGRFNRPGQQ